MVRILLTTLGIPQDTSTPRDATVEQMTPITTWGMTFAIAPTPNINRNEEYIIVAAEDNTRIQFRSQTTQEDVSTTGSGVQRSTGSSMMDC